MNTATVSIRLTAAASAAVIAVTFAGCASADAASKADTSKSNIHVGQGLVRFVPSDDDPRGHHVVRESADQQLESGVDDILSPLTGQ